MGREKTTEKEPRNEQGVMTAVIFGRVDSNLMQGTVRDVGNRARFNVYLHVNVSCNEGASLFLSGEKKKTKDEVISGEDVCGRGTRTQNNIKRGKGRRLTPTGLSSLGRCTGAEDLPLTSSICR